MKAHYEKTKPVIKTLVIAGLEFQLAKINFSTMVKIEKMGIGFGEWEKRPLAFVVAIMAVSTGLNFNDAADKIQQHIDNGGNIDELIDATEEAVQTAIMNHEYIG